jgi:DUF2934 family protein
VKVVAKSASRKTPVGARRAPRKRAKAKSADQAGGVATIETVAPEAPDRDPNDDDIRVRAYFRYLERGGAPGDSVDDWAAAKRDLETKKST